MNLIPLKLKNFSFLANILRLQMTQYDFDETCQGSVPQAIICFLESENYEDAVRNAVSLGGDSDTLACITGGIAEAFYGDIPPEIEQKVFNLLIPEFRKIVELFRVKYR